MTKKCDNCGFESNDLVKFCTNCGAPLTESENQHEIPHKNKISPFKDDNYKKKDNSIQNKNHKIFFGGLIVVLILAIVIGSQGIYDDNYLDYESQGTSATAGYSDTVNLTFTELNSYAQNQTDYDEDYNSYDTGELEYVYVVGGKLYPSNVNENLEEYTAKVTFYNNNQTVTTDEGYISFYGGNNFNCEYITTGLVNVTDVKVEIINPEGTVVCSEESPFTMGDMTRAT